MAMVLTSSSHDGGAPMTTRSSRVKWMLASSRADLEPARYLGVLRDLPAPGEPGDWCDVVVRDERGEMRWRVVVVDTARSTPQHGHAEREPVRSASAAG
jgi:hypothetical protein